MIAQKILHTYTLKQPSYKMNFCYFLLENTHPSEEKPFSCGLEITEEQFIKKFNKNILKLLQLHFFYEIFINVF